MSHYRLRLALAPASITAVRPCFRGDWRYLTEKRAVIDDSCYTFIKTINELSAETRPYWRLVRYKSIMLLRRCVLICTLVGLTLKPFTVAYATRSPGGGVAIFPRYHFATGQRLSYKIVNTSQVTNSHQDSNSVTNSQSHFGPVRSSIFIQERVLSVDSSGKAILAESEIDPAVAGSQYGHSNRGELAARAVIVAIAPNGTEQRIGPSASSQRILVSTIGTLPPGPVRLGAHWSSQAIAPGMQVEGKAMLVMRGTVQSSLVGFGYADSEPVAIIRSVGYYHTSSMSAVFITGKPFRQQITETVSATERLLFGLTSSHLVSSQLQTDAFLTFHSQGVGSNDILQIRASEQTLIQRVSM